MPLAVDHLTLPSWFDKNVSKPTCEANGCYNKATNQIAVNVGRHGSIDLNLCKSCIPEFKENNKERLVSVQDTNRSTHNPRPVSMSNGTKRRSSS